MYRKRQFSLALYQLKHKSHFCVFQNTKHELYVLINTKIVNQVSIKTSQLIFRASLPDMGSTHHPSSAKEWPHRGDGHPLLIRNRPKAFADACNALKAHQASSGCCADLCGRRTSIAGLALPDPPRCFRLNAGSSEANRVVGPERNCHNLLIKVTMNISLGNRSGGAW